MNQDSFRTLLKTPASSSSARLATQPTSGNTKHGKKSANTVSAAEPSSSKTAFKPRKVAKPLPAGYRDRASERRAGVNDYADVEKVLDNFEKQAANAEDKQAVEEQRQYLGGDEKHTVLVKGLDFALLEQAKARSGNSKEDDDALEEAFLEAATPATVVPKKRTREDLLKELKSKRDMPADSETTPEEPEVPAAEKSLEKAKQMGKFKPIGAPSDSKVKAKEEKKKKKKRKVAAEDSSAVKAEGLDVPAASAKPPPPPDSNNPSVSARVKLPTPPPPVTKKRTPSPPPSEPDEDVDIFADAGAYEGIDLGDEDEDMEDGETKAAPPQASTSNDQPMKPKLVNWFNDPIPEPEPTPPPEPERKEAATARAGPSGSNVDVEEGEEEEEPMRLQPLASSSIRDIKTFLDADKELEKEEKRKARKEKNKAKNK